jgi:hypothetical protein
MLPMPSQPSLDSLLDKLGDQEPEFLYRVRSRVHSYVRGTGKECVAIVEKDAYGLGRPRTHHIGIDSYIHVLWCFLRKEPYHHHELDSALTEPVAQIVGECYDEFLKGNSEIISQHFLQQMMENELILEIIMGEALDRAAKKGMSTIRSKAVHVMVEGVKHAASTHLGHSVSSHVSAGISAAAGTAVAHKLGPILLKMIVMHSQAIVTHLLSSAAFKAAAHAAVKHCAYVAASAAFLHVVSAKVGMAHASALLHAAGALVIGAIIGHAIFTLPGELAKKISDSVVGAMHTEFRAMNRMNVERVALEIFGTDRLTSAVAGEISKSGAVEEVMKHFGDNLAEEAEQGYSVLRSFLNYWGW